MENIEPIKIDANTLGVIETIPEKVLPQVSYDYSFLKRQLIDAQNQKDFYIAMQDKEIARIQFLIAEADKLGIVDKI